MAPAATDPADAGPTSEAAAPSPVQDSTPKETGGNSAPVKPEDPSNEGNQAKEPQGEMVPDQSDPTQQADPKKDTDPPGENDPQTSQAENSKPSADPANQDAQPVAQSGGAKQANDSSKDADPGQNDSQGSNNEDHSKAQTGNDPSKSGDSGQIRGSNSDDKDTSKASNDQSNWDPSQAAPAQMSQIKDALGSKPQGTNNAQAPDSTQPSTSQEEHSGESGDTNMDKTTQGNTNQDKPNQDGTNQNTANQGSTNPGSTNQGSTNQDNTKHGSTNQDNMKSDQASNSDGGQSPSADDTNQEDAQSNQAPAEPTTIAGHAVTPLANGVSIHDTLLTPGAAAATFSGTPVSVDSSNNIYFGQASYQLPTHVAPTPIEPTTIAGHAITPLSNGVSLYDTLVTPGAAPATFSGTPVSVDSSNHIYFGKTSYQLPAPAPATPSPTQVQPATIAGHEVTPFSNGVSISNTILTPGAAAITLSGTPVSVDSSNHIYFGGSSYSLPTPPPLTNQPAAPTSIALDKSSNIIIDGKTHVLASFLAATTTIGQTPTTTISGQTIALASNGGISIAGTTLQPGSAGITIPASSSIAPLAPLTTKINDLPLTATALPGPNGSNNEVIVAGTTLSPGSAGATAIVSGTPVHLDEKGAMVVGQGSVAKTAGLSFSAQSTKGSGSRGLGGLIMGGFGPAESTGSGSGSETRTSTSSSMAGGGGAGTGSGTGGSGTGSSGKPAQTFKSGARRLGVGGGGVWCSGSGGGVLWVLFWGVGWMAAFGVYMGWGG